MLTTRSMLVLGIALLAGSCTSRAPAEPEIAPAAPAARALERPSASIIEDLGAGLAGELVTRGLEAIGLFDALGLGEPDDQTAQQLTALSAKLDAMTAQLESVKDSIDTRILTAIAEQAIRDQATAYQQCRTTLLDLRNAPVSGPESFELRNRTLLLRAYQLTGLSPPSGQTLQDDDCALGLPIARLQATVLSTGVVSEQDHFLTALARQARANRLPFDSVARYFTWVVGVQRRALELMAQAHRRLGEDALLAQKAAAMRRSLRLQGIELLRAAEAYAAATPPGATGPAFADADAAAALALADRVVGLLEGRTWLLTASVITPPLEAHAPEVPLALPPGAEQGGVPLDDVLSEVDELGATQAYYLTRREQAVASYPYAFPLTIVDFPVEIGRSTRAVFHRFRSRPGAGQPGMTTLGFWAHHALRTVTMERLDAVTLAPEDVALDRVLLAHPDGLASTLTGFHLLPSEADPRQVTMTVDQPFWSLTGVPVGPVAGDAGYAARPDVSAAVFTLEPYGPAEPDRYALRIGDGQWLGVASTTSPGPRPLTAVAAPFYFDLVREGGGVRLSFQDGTTGQLWHVFVNAQVLAGSDAFVPSLTFPLDLAPYGGTSAYQYYGRVALPPDRFLVNSGDPGLSWRVDGTATFSNSSLHYAFGWCNFTRNGAGAGQLCWSAGTCPQGNSYAVAGTSDTGDTIRIGCEMFGSDGTFTIQNLWLTLP